MSAVLTQCPKCRAELVGDVESVRWCQQCNWNVDPGREVPVISTRGQRAQVRREQELFERLLTSPPTRPASRRQVIGMFLLILPFLVFHLGLLAAAVYVYVAGAGSWVWRLVFGSIVAGFGVLPWLLTIHRRSPMPVLEQADAPQLFEQVQSVAAALAASPPQRVVFDVSHVVSISWGLRGWTLHIGLPLWMSLTPQQRAALVANRVTAARHFRSLDGFVMRAADMFERAYDVGGRVDVWLREPKQVTPLAVFRWPLLAYMKLKGRLMCDSNVRLSYWCDRRAAEVTSPATVVEALVRMHSAGYRASARAERWGYRDEAGLWPLLQSLSEPLVPSEQARWERAARLFNTFDPPDSRPPVGHRIAVLEASPVPAQQVSLLAIGADHELAQPVAQLARLMVHGG